MDVTKVCEDLEPSKASASGIGFSFAWAFVAGATLPLATANNTFLNTRSPHHDGQAFYTALLGIVLGGLGVLPLALRAPLEPSLPTTWWSWLGGLCTLPSFGILLAVPVLGVQVPLLIVLCGQLWTTLLVDSLEGRPILSETARLIGLGAVVFGCVMDALQSGAPDVRSSLAPARISTSTLVVITIAAGIGYTSQAKCNNMLAKSLGSPARATFVSALVNLSASIPIVCLLCFGLEVYPVFLLDDWWRFLAAALQSAFYIYTMSILPSKIGYTACFLAIHAGMLCVSAGVDALGMAGDVRRIGLNRCTATGLVLLGAYVFNKDSAHDTLNTECAEWDEGKMLQAQKFESKFI